MNAFEEILPQKCAQLFPLHLTPIYDGRLLMLPSRVLSDTIQEARPLRCTVLISSYVCECVHILKRLATKANSENAKL